MAETEYPAADLGAQYLAKLIDSCKAASKVLGPISLAVYDRKFHLVSSSLEVTERSDLSHRALLMALGSTDCQGRSIVVEGVKCFIVRSEIDFVLCQEISGNALKSGWLALSGEVYLFIVKIR